VAFEEEEDKGYAFYFLLIPRGSDKLAWLGVSLVHIRRFVVVQKLIDLKMGSNI